MLKLTGAIMIILSGSLWGFLKASALKTRWKSLEKIIYSLRIMENEISYGKSDLAEILYKIRILGGINFSEECFKNAGICFFDAVCHRELNLSDCDKALLSGFSKTLGTTDSQVQLRNIKNTIKSLEIFGEEAKESYLRYGKMYRSIGSLLGILAVIILA